MLQGRGNKRLRTPRSVCLICQGTKHRLVLVDGGIEVLRCQRCGHVFSGSTTDVHFDGFWGSEVPDSEHFYWSDSRRSMHEDFFRTFLAGRRGRLLDMGSGLGFFVKAVAAQGQWESFGCEISPAAAQYARGKLGLHNIVCSRLEDAPFANESFQIITFWDVLEHLPEPDRVLSTCYRLLGEGGMLFIRTPNVSAQILRSRFRGWLPGAPVEASYLKAVDHAHHYSERSICSLLERNGFSDIRLRHLHPIGAISRRRRLAGRIVKDAVYEGVRALAVLTGGRINLDTLFVVAYKTSHSAA